jgi:hypothetical protein
VATSKAACRHELKPREGIHVLSTCQTQAHLLLCPVGSPPERPGDGARPGVRHGRRLRGLELSVVRSTVPAPPLPAAVPSLHGGPAAHLHQVRLSAAGVQSVRPAALRLLPALLAPMAVRAGLVALSVPGPRRDRCSAAPRHADTTHPRHSGRRHSADAAPPGRATGTVTFVDRGAWTVDREEGMMLLRGPRFTVHGPRSTVHAPRFRKHWTRDRL